MEVDIFSIGAGVTHDEAVDISSVSGSGPWTVTLSAPVPADVVVGDALLDEAATPLDYLITGINGSDLTVEDREAHGTGPDSSGTSSAQVLRYYNGADPLTDWEADIDNTTYPNVTTTAQGEIYDDAELDESLSISTVATNVVNRILTVPELERNDGTEGTGSRIVYSANGGLQVPAGSLTGEVRLEGFELSMEGFLPIANQSMIYNNESAIDFIIQRMLLRGPFNTSPIIRYGIRDLRTPVKVSNCFLYGFNLDAGGASRTLQAISGVGSGNVQAQNNTIHDLVVIDGGSASCIGIQTDDDGDTIVRNNLVTDVSGAATSRCYGTPNVNGTISHNLSSDTTAPDDSDPGTALHSKTAADQYISTSPVNLHLIDTDADAYNAGTDLGTTPSGVEIDIDGWNRDSDTPSRDPWDMGAHEFESVAPPTGGTTNPFSLGAVNLLQGKIH